MGRKKSSKTKEAKSTRNNGREGDGNLISVDPRFVRFQHSRIRPAFSGCGRSVMGTLDSIRKRETSPYDLPPIQVIAGPEDDEGRRWYFSLNNRRLWVLKRCREEGLLENNQIFVRVREPKSRAEAARYSLENCAVEAKLMREAVGNKPTTQKASAKTDVCLCDTGSTNENADCSDPDEHSETQGANQQVAVGKESESGIKVGESNDDSDTDSSNGVYTVANRFSALF